MLLENQINFADMLISSIKEDSSKNIETTDTEEINGEEGELWLTQQHY